MEYYIKQKVFTFFRSEYTIKDAELNDLFTARSNIGLPFKLKIYEINKTPTVVIRKRYFRFLSRYDIKSIENNKLLAILKARPSVISKRFKIISKTESLDNLSLQGDVLGLNFSIVNGKEVMAAISKKVFAIGDSYRLQIYDEQNRDLYFAIALAVDTALQKKRNR